MYSVVYDTHMFSSSKQLDTQTWNIPILKDQKKKNWPQFFVWGHKIGVEQKYDIHFDHKHVEDAFTLESLVDSANILKTWAAPGDNNVTNKIPKYREDDTHFF